MAKQTIFEFLASLNDAEVNRRLKLLRTAVKVETRMDRADDLLMYLFFKLDTEKYEEIEDQIKDLVFEV